jgi:hypothetical protein
VVVAQRKWREIYSKLTAMSAITHGLLCGLKKPLTLTLSPCLPIVTEAHGPASGFLCGKAEKTLLSSIDSNGLLSLFAN